MDVHNDGLVSADVTGSFRELLLFIQDDNTLTKEGRSSGSAINLRVAPLKAREGDPPLLEAYLGDPIVIRGLVSEMNDVHTLHVDGHWFRLDLTA